MIRGVKQPFKFTTPTDFTDIDRIEVIFSQPHNQGNPPTAPMPIVKYYDKQLEEVDQWDETNEDLEMTQTYQVGTKYYRYNSATSEFTSSSVQPTESDLSGGPIATYPVEDNDSIHISKIYKCNESYYQYNPTDKVWDITSGAPNIEPQSLSRVGVSNIPSSADKKRTCVYAQSYHRYDGASWKTSTTEILPIEEIGYWEPNKEDEADYYDRDKTYCALETYYRYDGNAWITYGRPQEVRALNSDCDTTKIYMMKSFYYQYNVDTDKFEKTGVHEVYYKYNATNRQWEECEYPCANAVKIDLWLDADEHDTSKLYVCKNVYYRYNAGLDTPAWEVSNNMLVPVVEIDEWVDSEYHDASKIYMCPARYYQYNIEEEAWEETETTVAPQIVKLNYWTEQTNKNNIYLCGPTYFKYDSASERWLSSPALEIQFTQIDYPSEAIDQSKIYKCSPTYYAYRGDKWESYKNVTDAVRNDGFAQVAGDPKSFVVELTAEETMRFIDKYKGRVQAIVDDISHPMEYFSVYPTLIDEIPNDAT